MNDLPREIYNLINQYLLFSESLQFLSINKILFFSFIRQKIIIRTGLQLSYLCGMHDGYIHGTNIYNRSLNNKFNLNNIVFTSLKCKKPNKNNVEFESWNIMEKITLKLHNFIKKNLENKF